MKKYRVQDYGCLKCGALVRLRAHSEHCADGPPAIHEPTFEKLKALTAEEFQKLMHQDLDETPARSDKASEVALARDASDPASSTLENSPNPAPGRIEGT